MSVHVEPARSFTRIYVVHTCSRWVRRPRLANLQILTHAPPAVHGRRSCWCGDSNSTNDICTDTQQIRAADVRLRQNARPRVLTAPKRLEETRARVCQCTVVGGHYMLWARIQTGSSDSSAQCIRALSWCCVLQVQRLVINLILQRRAVHPPCTHNRKSSKHCTSYTCKCRKCSPAAERQYSGVCYGGYQLVCRRSNFSVTALTQTICAPERVIATAF